MCGDFVFDWDGDGVGEEPTAGVSIVADADGDAGEPGDGGGFEGVLEEECGIEVAMAEGSGGGEFFEEGAFVGDEFVAEGLASVEGGNPRASEDGDASVGMVEAELLQSGERHDGVADPVCGAHQYVSELHSALSE